MSEKSEVIPLAFKIMESVKQHLKVKLKGIVVKNIEGNRGKLGAQNIWKYRALKSDYFLFNRAEFPSTSGAHVRRHEIQK